MHFYGVLEDVSGGITCHILLQDSVREFQCTNQKGPITTCFLMGPFLN